MARFGSGRDYRPQLRVSLPSTRMCRRRWIALARRSMNAAECVIDRSSVERRGVGAQGRGPGAPAARRLPARDGKAAALGTGPIRVRDRMLRFEPAVPVPVAVAQARAPQIEVG